MDVNIFTKSRNNLYLISNHIWQPSSWNNPNHLDKFLISKTVYHLQLTHQSINIQNVHAHINILGNYKVDKLAKQGWTNDNIPLALTPFHLIGHHILYWQLPSPLPLNMMVIDEILKDTSIMNIEATSSLMQQLKFQLPPNGWPPPISIFHGLTNFRTHPRQLMHKSTGSFNSDMVNTWVTFQKQWMLDAQYSPLVTFVILGKRYMSIPPIMLYPKAS